MKKKNPKYLIGIDEAGRGPLAGPVAVGAVLVPHDFDFSVFSVVRDSKKLSPKVRERVFEEVKKSLNQHQISYHVALVNAATIDKKGITNAVREGIAAIFKKLAVDPGDVEVRLDGLLHAPSEFKNQKTVIKGDVTEPAISLASIMAKVTRDRYMVHIAKKYPRYGFEVHKGYGTKMHSDAIKKYGLSKIHRRSFCKKYKSEALEK